MIINFLIEAYLYSLNRISNFLKKRPVDLFLHDVLIIAYCIFLTESIFDEGLNTNFIIGVFSFSVPLLILNVNKIPLHMCSSLDYFFIFLSCFFGFLISFGINFLIKYSNYKQNYVQFLIILTTLIFSRIISSAIRLKHVGKKVVIYCGNVYDCYSFSRYVSDSRQREIKVAFSLVDNKDYVDHMLHRVPIIGTIEELVQVLEMFKENGTNIDSIFTDSSERAFYLINLIKDKFLDIKINSLWLDNNYIFKEKISKYVINGEKNYLAFGNLKICIIVNNLDILIPFLELKILNLVVFTNNSSIINFLYKKNFNFELSIFPIDKNFSNNIKIFDGPILINAYYCESEMEIKESNFVALELYYIFRKTLKEIIILFLKKIGYKEFLHLNNNLIEQIFLNINLPNVKCGIFEFSEFIKNKKGLICDIKNHIDVGLDFYHERTYINFIENSYLPTILWNISYILLDSNKQNRVFLYKMENKIEIETIFNFICRFRNKYVKNIYTKEKIKETENFLLTKNQNILEIEKKTKQIHDVEKLLMESNNSNEFYEKLQILFGNVS